MQLFEELTDEKNLSANLEWMDQVHTEQSYKALKEKGAFEKPGRIIPIRTVWIAAAAVLLLKKAACTPSYLTCIDLRV